MLKINNVLSLFDGISCGQLALTRAGIEYDKYFASEIDKWAIMVTQKNFPKTVQLGNVIDIDFTQLPKIDLLIGGSPCQDLSLAKRNRQSLNGQSSRLFYEYAKALNVLRPKYFLLENVASMNRESRDIISELLGVQPIEINSNLFSAQDRKRLYWTNIKVDRLPIQCDLVIKDILEKDVDSKYFPNRPFTIIDKNKRVVATDDHRNYSTNKIYNINFKSPILTCDGNGGGLIKKIFINEMVRHLTPIEYERLQTISDNYTSGLSNSQRYNCVGNGWTVDVIAHIFSHIK